MDANVLIFTLMGCDAFPIEDDTLALITWNIGSTGTPVASLAPRISSRILERW